MASDEHPDTGGWVDSLRGNVERILTELAAPSTRAEMSLGYIEDLLRRAAAAPNQSALTAAQVEQIGIFTASAEYRHGIGGTREELLTDKLRELGVTVDGGAPRG